MDKETLKKIFGDYRPNCKETTINQYAITLSKLSDHFNKDNDYLTDDFLNSPQEIFDYLKKRGSARSTQANILSTIIIYLQSKGKDNEVYRKQKDLLDESIELHYNSGKPTELQIDNWIPLKDIDEMMLKLDRLCDEPLQENASYNENWTKKEMEQVRLLFHLLIKHPSRNEYGCLRFITWRNYKKMMPLEIKDNYILIRSGKNPRLIISQYKTSKTYGIKEVEIKDRLLKRLINQKYKQIGENYLFTYSKQSDEKCWGRNYVSQMLGKWTHHLIGKRISSTILYKIIIHEIGLSYEQALQKEQWEIAEKMQGVLKEFAKCRGHSFKTQKKVYLVKNV